MSVDISARRFLGPAPYWAGFLYWSLAVLCTFSSWHFYQFAPTPGLLVVGLMPFVNMYLFFRGFNVFYRSILYFKTWNTVNKLKLKPTFSSFSGTFFVLDDQQGTFIANGTAGQLREIERLVCQKTSQAFRLQIFLKNTKLPLSIGVHDNIHLQQLALHLQATIETFCSHHLELEHLNE